MAELPARFTGTALEANWELKLGEILTKDAKISLSDEEQERHRIYSLLAMSLVSSRFNGNKRGESGTYPLRSKQLVAPPREGSLEGRYSGGNYYGHNIAALAVDGNGDIIDFDFNHNELFNSSVEHAESRLVRRIFSLTQIYDGWRTGQFSQDRDYANILKQVTVYTTLESCAQCAGIMNLGNIKAVAYLQTDPGQFMVGNLIHQLGSLKLASPRPVAASNFGFQYFDQLDQAYADFIPKAKDQGFYTSGKSGAKYDRSGSLTSFLCTDDAKDIFDAARAEFESLVLKYPQYVPQSPQTEIPSTADPTTAKSTAKSNEDALIHCQNFFKYSVDQGRRGTPHKL